MWVTVPSSFSLKMLSLSKASALNLQERVKAGLGIPFPAAHSALAPWPGRLVPLGMGSQAIAPGSWGQQHPWGSSRGRPVTWSPRHPQWPRVLLTYRCPSAAPGARSPKLLSEGRRRSGGEAAGEGKKVKGFGVLSWGLATSLLPVFMLVHNSRLRTNCSCSTISPLLLGADSTHHAAQVNPRGPTHLRSTPPTCYSWSPRGASSERLGHGELGLLAKEAVPALTPCSPGGPWAVLPTNTAPCSRPAHQPEDEVDGEHGRHATEGQPLQDGAAGAGAEALLLRAVHQGVQEAEHVQRGGAGTVRRWVH